MNSSSFCRLLRQTGGGCDTWKSIVGDSTVGITKTNLPKRHDARMKIGLKVEGCHKNFQVRVYLNELVVLDIDINGQDMNGHVFKLSRSMLRIVRVTETHKKSYLPMISVRFSTISSRLLTISHNALHCVDVCFLW